MIDALEGAQIVMAPTAMDVVSAMLKAVAG
jgi:hypothetical protein